MSYNRGKHITAREIREMGVEIPASIPGHAYTYRTSLRLKSSKTVKKASGATDLLMSFDIVEPFTWMGI